MKSFPELSADQHIQHDELLIRIRNQLYLNKVKNHKLVLLYFSILAVTFFGSNLSQPSTKISIAYQIFLFLSVVFFCVSTTLFLRESRLEEKAYRDLSLYLSTLPGPTTLLSYQYIDNFRTHILYIEYNDKNQCNWCYSIKLSAEAGLEIIDSRKPRPHQHSTKPVS